MFVFTFKHIQKKINYIKDPQHNNSYCVISIQMLKLMQFVSVLQSIMNFSMLVMIIFDVIIYPQTLPILIITYMVPLILGRFIQILQAYEWVIMINIIREQRAKTLEEIMFEVNNSSSHVKFLKKERRTKRIF